MAKKKATKEVKKTESAPTIEEIVAQIHELDKLTYAEYGENDENGYQVFTPEFIVEGMIKAVGTKEVDDISKTILEPTSGDGAFTGRILERRLKKLIKNKDSYPANSIRAISTIYSIEMDKALMEKQRDNVFTVFMQYARKAKLDADEKYVNLAKLVIAHNFMWGMTNMENPIMPISHEVAYRMPEAENGEQYPLSFYVWTINDDFTYDMHEEDVDV